MKVSSFMVDEIYDYNHHQCHITDPLIYVNLTWPKAEVEVPVTLIFFKSALLVEASITPALEGIRYPVTVMPEE